MINYDQEYAKPEFYWGKEPSRLAQQLMTKIGEGKGKKLIDIGSGEGKEAIYFAKHGLQVTAMDLSQPGLEKTKHWAAEEGVSIQTIQANLLDFRLADQVDYIYSSGVLTYLPSELRLATFEHYKEQTTIGGIHAFNIFVEKPWIPVPPDYAPNEYFYRSGEILQYYWDWNILHYKEFVFDCMSSGIPHQHAIGVMLAQKKQ